MRPASRRIGAARAVCVRAVDELQRKGPRSLASRTAGFLKRQALQLLRIGPALTPALRPDGVRLGLQRGDWVEVRSEDEIRETLDSTGRSRGLGFMPSMFAYCGKRLRVYKRVETIVLEGTGETRRLRDTVLLEGAICDGEGFVCDRSCFYFWKETWLKRAVPDEATVPGGRPM
ncbi:MAG: hypothetical protein ACM3SQ_14760 [Betaproteobacteria bacterium]